MNDDDDDDDSGVQDSSSGAQLQPHVFSRIRNFNNLAMNSIGALFRSSQLGTTDGFGSADWDYDLWNDTEATRTLNSLEENNQVHAQDLDSLNTGSGMLTAEASTPTQTRSNSPLRSNHFQTAKRILTNFARSRHSDSGRQLDLGHSILDEPHAMPLSMTPSSINYASGSSASDHFVTPPLTPDVLDDQSPAPPSYIPCDIPYDPYRPPDHSLAPGFGHDEGLLYAQSHCPEIKEGKKPARVIVRGICRESWLLSFINFSVMVA